MLEVKELAYNYNNKKEVLKNVNLSLSAHDILCLLGPNGTGKTTLLRSILGLNKIKKGEVLLNGKNLFKIPPVQRAKMMAYVPQALTMSFPYRVDEVVLMGRTAHLGYGMPPSKEDEEISEQSLEVLGISHLADRSFNEISGGERQMAFVARAIAQRARILIMDEPTANLDYANQIRMLRVVNELSKKGYAILMTSHFPDHGFLACNKVALLKGGRVLEYGKPKEVITTKTLTNLYDTPVCVSTAMVEGEPKSVCIPLM